MTAKSFLRRAASIALVALTATGGSVLLTAPAQAGCGGGGGGGKPPPQVTYQETPGQRAMKRHNQKVVVKQPKPLSRPPGQQAPVPFHGKQPTSGNPSGPVPFKSYANPQ